MHSYVVVAHLLLAAVLFFIMNWIGGHAVVTARYYQISYFSRYDDAPAFNALFRILAPVVFIIIAAAGFHALGLSDFVSGIYWVVIYQQLIRWGYVFLMNRWRLARWGAQIAIAAATVGLAVLAYHVLIKDPRRLLPEPTNLANEVWLIILAFLYKISDNAIIATEGNKRRKETYLRARFLSLRQRFGKVIDASVSDPLLRPLIYAVLIYETFNRPSLVQILERLLPSLGPRSYGPMQVQAARRLSDEESVRLGAQKLMHQFESAVGPVKTDESNYGDVWNRRQATEAALAAYNVRSDYASEVMAIHEFLVQTYFKEYQSTLLGLG
jgi:hypothetical protein